MADDQRLVDVVVIGGGQAGLATGYYLRRTGLDWVLLDAESGPGGAWRHTWDSVQLFSPARWSSLPGYIMPGGPDKYPSRREILGYFEEYERRYSFPIVRPTLVRAVSREGQRLRVESDRGTWLARAVVSATGSWRRPYIPELRGRDEFTGLQMHSARYRTPLEFTGQRVLVVGGANSGAQIMAELAPVADATWVTRRTPTFMPADVDGRTLFERATARYIAAQKGEEPEDMDDQGRFLGDIVMLPPVLEAHSRGDLASVPMFVAMTEDGVIWADGTPERIDAVIWCTGFRSALDHLAPLAVVNDGGEVDTVGSHCLTEERLWLVGYGEWTGFASATLVGVGRSARSTVDEIVTFLDD